MDDEFQRLRQFWEKNDPNSDFSELEKLWRKLNDHPKIITPHILANDDFRNFRTNDEKDYYNTSQNEGFGAKLWLIIPLFIIIFIISLCYQYISKSRSPQSRPVPQAPRISRPRSATFMNLVEPSTTRTVPGGSLSTPESGMIFNTRGRIYLIENNGELRSSNNLRTDQHTRPIMFNIGIDPERNSRGTLSNHSVSNTSNAELLPSDKPPAYNTVISSDSCGESNKFPAVPLRASTESPPPSYDDRRIYNS